MYSQSPKNNPRYKWTMHVVDKMRYYGLSESIVKRIMRFPTRVEEGIAPDTVAVMQPASNKKKPTEIWVLYQRKTPASKTIISAWRYPGISPIGKKITIPDDVLQEIENIV